MSSSCAICEGPIPNGSKFYLLGSEVVHRACARNGLPTSGWKLRKQVAELQRQAAASDAELLRTQVERGQLQRELMTARQQLERLEASAEVHRQARRQRDVAQRALEVSQEQLAQATRELEQARAQIAQLTRDAANASSRTAESTTSTPANIDDTALRFSLLEIDAS